MIQRRPTPRLLTLVLGVVAVIVCMVTLRNCSERLRTGTEVLPPTTP